MPLIGISPPIVDVEIVIPLAFRSSEERKDDGTKTYDWDVVVGGDGEMLVSSVGDHL